LLSYKTRFTVKYRHVDAKVILKVTNDRVVRRRNTVQRRNTVRSAPLPRCLTNSPRLRSQCIKFRTDQQQDVKKLDKFNNVMMRHMTSRHE
jgi:hypothetical protein